MPDPRIGNTIDLFQRIYLRGIPPIITDESAFLSFICVITAVEALSGYRFGGRGVAERFKKFIQMYFPNEYHPLTSDLWQFRTKMVHAFSPGPFTLMHHNGEMHLDDNNGSVILNAEDFFNDLKLASETYFNELRGNVNLQNIMLHRLAQYHGGAIAVIPVITGILSAGEEQ